MAKVSFPNENQAGPPLQAEVAHAPKSDKRPVVIRGGPLQAGSPTAGRKIRKCRVVSESARDAALKTQLQPQLALLERVQEKVEACTP